MSLTNLGIGFAGSDWTAYTPTFTAGFGTPTGVNFQYRRVGDTMEIQGTFTPSSTAATVARISLPSGYSVDTTKLSTSGTIIGIVTDNVTNTSGVINMAYAFIASGQTTNISFGGVGNGSTTNNLAELNVNAIFGSTLTSLSVKVPIAGWSSNISIGSSSTYRISSYLANGTRVTGTAPTALGQYRYYTRGASSTTWTDSAAAVSPTANDGIPIWRGAGYGTADTASNPTRIDIFVGKNKNVFVQAYASAGRTGLVAFSGYSFSTQDIGFHQAYDPTTGILTLTRPVTGSATAHYPGKDPTTGDVLTNSLIYVDAVVSENALAVGIAAPRSEVILSNDAGAGSTNTKVRNFSSVSNTGTAATGTLDAVNGAYVTINEDGVYGFQWDAVRFTATDTVQITRNSSIYLNPADTSKVLTQIDITAANLHYSPSGTRILRAGDVIRVLTFTSSLTSGNPTYHKLVVTKVSN